MELRRPRASEESGSGRAGAAFLCLACDAGFHSANELASRHVRVPLDPFVDAAAAPGPVAMGSVPDFLATPADGACRGSWRWREEDEEEAKSWLVPNPTKITKGAEAEAGDAFWNEVDPFLEFECGGSTAIGRINGECLVPVQAKAVNPPGKCFHVDFSTSANVLPLSQSVSKSLHFGVVLDENSAPETPRTNRAAHTLGRADREARVSRYREKRKNRRFEKTIRYTSRKEKPMPRRGRGSKAGLRRGVDSSKRRMRALPSMSMESRRMRVRRRDHVSACAHQLNLTGHVTSSWSVQVQFFM